MFRRPSLKIRLTVWCALAVLPFSGCSCDPEEGLVSRIGKLQVDPTHRDFGAPFLGETSTREITLTNVGEATLRFESWTFSNEAFALNSIAPEELNVGDSVTVSLAFTPQLEGLLEGTLVIGHDGEPKQNTVTLNGVGAVQPEPPPPPPAQCSLTVTPAALDFSSILVGNSIEQTVTVTNTSQADCRVESLQITGGSASSFSLITAAPLDIPAGQLAQVRLSFTRQDASPVGAVLEIATTDPVTPVFYIGLSAGMTGPGLCVNPTSIHFGAVSSVATQNITLTGCGDHDVIITALDWTTANAEISLSAAPSLPFVLRQGANLQITVQYAPTDQMDDTAVLTILSDDAVVPSVTVAIDGSPDIVPEEVGRYLYFWQIGGAGVTSDIVRAPLQGGGGATPFWGQSSGQLGCPGCHQVSSDGRYVAMVEFGFITRSVYVVDTMSRTKISLPFEVSGGGWFTWRPDVNSNPPYKYAVGKDGEIHLGSIGGGYLGALSGANDAASSQGMPTWGPNGQIAFVRGTEDPANADFGFSGSTDLMLIPEAGGTATPVAGASGNGKGNYYPAFSPNGTWLAFTQNSGAGATYASPDAQVRLVKTDGSGTVQNLPLANGTDGASSFPTWSIDGTYLSISSNRSGGVGDWDIYIAPIDPVTGVEGGPAVNLQTANTPGFEHAAQWSP